MTPADYTLTAICLYREARGEGNTGMTAVACVIRNRVQQRHSTPYAIVTAKWQFSSLTDPHDPQLAIWPAETDAAWQQAQLIAGNVLNGDTQDITQGATMYYDDSIPFPKSWNLAVLKSLGKIGRFNIYREILP